MDQEKEESPLEALRSVGKVFRATLVDKDGQPLATGETLPVGKPDEFRFVLDNPENNLRAFPTSASFLKTSRGEKFRVEKLRQCGCGTSLEHYIFSLVSLY